MESLNSLIPAGLTFLMLCFKSHNVPQFKNVDYVQNVSTCIEKNFHYLIGDFIQEIRVNTVTILPPNYIQKYCNKREVFASCVLVFHDLNSCQFSAVCTIMF